MKVYVDSNYCCHAAAAEGLREFELGFFDGKCDSFIEGYRYLPAGESWTRADGKVFSGEMISPLTDYAALLQAQLEYELSLAQSEIEDMRAALEILGVTDDEEVA